LPLPIPTTRALDCPLLRRWLRRCLDLLQLDAQLFGATLEQVVVDEVLLFNG
jgi:hypothetical protein